MINNVKIQTTLTVCKLSVLEHLFIGTDSLVFVSVIIARSLEGFFRTPCTYVYVCGCLFLFKRILFQAPGIILYHANN